MMVKHQEIILNAVAEARAVLSTTLSATDALDTLAHILLADPQVTAIMNEQRPSYVPQVKP